MPDNPPGEWSVYERLVLAELERHGRLLGTLEGKLHEVEQALRIEIATLKVKAGVWGALSGMIPVILAFLGYLLTRMGK